MPDKSEPNFIRVFDGASQRHSDRWKLCHKIGLGGQFRHLVESEDESLIGIVKHQRGEYYFTAGPMTLHDAEAAATGIVFNHGSSVDKLKGVAGAFLSMLPAMRELSKLIKNQKDEGV